MLFKGSFTGAFFFAASTTIKNISITFILPSQYKLLNEEAMALKPSPHGLTYTP